MGLPVGAQIVHGNALVAGDGAGMTEEVVYELFVPAGEDVRGFQAQEELVDALLLQSQFAGDTI